MNRREKNYLNSYGIYFAWITACIATLGSLFYGEILGYAPCSLCWYQRVAMFPLAIILGIAAYRDEKAIFPYATPLIFFGVVIAVFQIATGFLPQKFCGPEQSCSPDQYLLFGKISFPFVSLFAFLVLFFFLFKGCSQKNANV